MTRSSFLAATVFVMVASVPAFACPGGMMGGGQQDGHGMGMHAMMHGQGRGMGHGQHMMGQGCPQGGGVCPMSSAAEQPSPPTSNEVNKAHAGDQPAIKK